MVSRSSCGLVLLPCLRAYLWIDYGADISCPPSILKTPPFILLSIDVQCLASNSAGNDIMYIGLELVFMFMFHAARSIY